MVEPWSWAWIGDKLWDMPGGVGALIGFGALAWATHRGYRKMLGQKEEWPRFLNSTARPSSSRLRRSEATTTV